MQIRISDLITLQKISLNDQKKLYDLMRVIYVPIYHHLWKDKGEWYLDELYSKENLQKELLEENQEYYFVLYENETIGILRLQFDVSFKGLQDRKSLKLHRIYLHSKTQGKGIGKQLLKWIESTGIEKGYKKFWLKAMNTQEQVLVFYKKRGFSIIKKTSLDLQLLHQHLRGMYIMSKKLN